MISYARVDMYTYYIIDLCGGQSVAVRNAGNKKLPLQKVRAMGAALHEQERCTAGADYCSICFPRKPAAVSAIFTSI